MSLTREIMIYLDAQVTGASWTSTGAWRIVANEFLPGSIGGSTQAQQICVTPTGGFNQEYAEALTYPTFQVRVRGSSTGSTGTDAGRLTGAEAKMGEVVSVLNLLGRKTLANITSTSLAYAIGTPGQTGDRVYLDILQQGDLLFIGRDELQRPMYAANFMALRSRTT